MTTQQQIDIIRAVMKKRTSFISCDHCEFEYLPMNREAQLECPNCGLDHGEELDEVDVAC